MDIRCPGDDQRREAETSSPLKRTSDRAGTWRRPFLRALLLACTLALVAASAACGGLTGGAGMMRPVVTVIRQAEPSPLRNARIFQIAPVTFDGLTFDGVPEATWLAGRSQNQGDSWDNDKRMVTTRILSRLKNEAGEGVTIVPPGAPLPPAGFVLAINVDRFEESTFRGTLRVLDGRGQVVDEVRLPVRYGGRILPWVDSFALSLNTFVTWAAADSMIYVLERSRPSDAPAGDQAERAPSPAPVDALATRPAVIPGGAPGPVAPPPSCKTHLDCKGGLVCSQGQCARPQCVSDKECGAGKFCTIEGACQTPGAPPPTSVVCKRDGDCQSGAFCDRDDRCKPLSTLSRAVVPPPPPPAVKPPPAVPVCKRDGDCQSGTFCDRDDHCKPLSTLSRAAPPPAPVKPPPTGPVCKGDADCRAGTFCDRDDHCKPLSTLSRSSAPPPAPASDTPAPPPPPTTDTDADIGARRVVFDLRVAAGFGYGGYTETRQNPTSGVPKSASVGAFGLSTFISAGARWRHFGVGAGIGNLVLPGAEQSYEQPVGGGMFVPDKATFNGGFGGVTASLFLSRFRLEGLIGYGGVGGKAIGGGAATVVAAAGYDFVRAGMLSFGLDLRLTSLFVSGDHPNTGGHGGPYLGIWLMPVISIDP